MGRGLARLRQLGEIARHLRYERTSFRSLPIADLSTDQRDVSETIRWLGPIDLGGRLRQALYCHPASTVSYRVGAKPGDRIATACGLLPEVWDRNSGGVQFSLTVESPEGRVIRSRVIRPGQRPDDRQWRSLVAGVPLQAPGEITVTLRTQVPAGANGSYAWAIWGEPVIQRHRAGITPGTVLRTVAAAIIRQGFKPALRALYAGTRVDAGKAQYQAWFARQAPTPEALARMAADAARLPSQPLVSIVTPAYNTPPALLRACIASVLAQTYRNWEWCLCNDASTSPETMAVFREQTDPRIRVIDLERNAGIALASQAALDAARGEFIALLDSDDELTPDALFQIATRLNDAPDLDVIYSDEDKRDEDGGLSEPYFKPDWSPDHLLSAMYTCHLTVARRSLVATAGGFRQRCDGSQDHDLMLRLSDLTIRIEHLPRVLYHWRRAPMSGATQPGSKPWADDAGRKAVADHLERHGLGSDVDSGGVPGLYRPRFVIRTMPDVLAVILGEDAAAVAACEARLRELTAYPRLTIASAFPICIEINAVVAQTSAAQIVCIDASLDVTDVGWLSALLEFSQQDRIGAAAGKVQYRDGRLRHIGLLLGVGGGVARAMHQHPWASYGYFSSAIGIRNYSAVSGELFMTRREVFESLGGFDESLPWIGADVDYCLKARRAGLRVVFTPYALAQVRTGATPPFAAPEDETIRQLRERWPAVFDRDPHYNPNLSKASGDYCFD